MTHSRLACTADQARATQPARAAGVLRRSWRAYWNWRAKQATVQILQALDERTLHDIGISPGEIESSVFGLGQERRRRYHEEWRTRVGV